MTEHESRCLAEHSRSVSRVLEEGHERDPQRFPEPRDETIVEFEGERVRWGDLCVQDRKAYWLGGYSF